MSSPSTPMSTVQNTVRNWLQQAGRMMLTAALPRQPVVLCSTSNPAANASVTNYGTAEEWQQTLRTIATPIVRLWGEQPFELSRFTGNVHTTGEAAREYDPNYVVWASHTERTDDVEELYLRFRSSTAGQSFLWVCACKHNAALELLNLNGTVATHGRHTHIVPAPANAGQNNAQNPQPNPNNQQQGTATNTQQPNANQQQQQLPNPQPAETPKIAQWIRNDQLLKITVRPSFIVHCGDQHFPTEDDLTQGRDPFTLTLAQAFNLATNRQANGRAVRFEGLLQAPANEPRMTVTQWSTLSPGVFRTDRTVARGTPAIDFLTVMERLGMPQSYRDVVDAYGGHEGGWYALQTYDGPKMSFGWAQMTFGPNPGGRNVEGQGWGKNFMIYLGHTYPDVFRRLFGRYGFRVSWQDQAAKDAWNTPTYNADAKPRSFFWRVPCCMSLQNVATPTSDIFTPPQAWKVKRIESASIGFIALMVQAYRDDGFGRAMVRWLMGMIDGAAGSLNPRNRTVSNVAISLKNNFIRPGVGYHLACEANPIGTRNHNNAWDQMFVSGQQAAPPNAQ